MKSSKVCYYSNRKILKEFGIEGLIPVERNFTRSGCSVDEDLFRKFAEYLINNKNESFKSNYEGFRQKYFVENPDTEDWDFPGYKAIKVRVKKELLQSIDKSQINIRKRIIWDEPQNHSIKMFTTATKDYLNNLDNSRKLKSTTLIHYKSCINNHVIPFFEKYTLAEITEDVIEKFRVFKREDHAFKGDICYPLLILQRILKVYSPNINDLPVNNCKTLHIDTRILTKEEIKKALNTARKQYKSFYPLLLTALLTGMTKGEILVLRWDNINFDYRKIFVNSSLNKGKIKKHTVKKSIREIDIPEILVNVLERWKPKCPEENNNLIFPDGNGKIQDSQYISNLQLTPLMDQSGIKNVNFIDLRDTYASLLIEQNFPLTYIQKQLGHNSVQITADRYKALLDKQNPKTIDFDKEIFAF